MAQESPIGFESVLSKKMSLPSCSAVEMGTTLGGWTGAGGRANEGVTPPVRCSWPEDEFGMNNGTLAIEQAAAINVPVIRQRPIIW